MDTSTSGSTIILLQILQRKKPLRIAEEQFQPNEAAGQFLLIALTNRSRHIAARDLARRLVLTFLTKLCKIIRVFLIGKIINFSIVDGNLGLRELLIKKLEVLKNRF